MFNIFRLSADFCHLFGIIYLLFRLCKTGNCYGASGKSQLLLAIVFSTRYIDLMQTNFNLFPNFREIYNFTFKLFFILSSYFLVYSIFFKLRKSYESKNDILRTELLIVPAVVLALYINHTNEPMEVLWTFSIYLEAVAILPQMLMIYKTGYATTYIIHYLMALGSYRALYILNWIYRYNSQGFYDLIAAIAGIFQTSLYIFFFTWYILKAPKRPSVYTLQLPMPGPENYFMDKEVIKNETTTPISIVTENQNANYNDEKLLNLLS